jgi:hypothetical protein
VARAREDSRPSAYKLGPRSQFVGSAVEEGWFRPSTAPGSWERSLRLRRRSAQETTKISMAFSYIPDPRRYASAEHPGKTWSSGVFQVQCPLTSAATAHLTSSTRRLPCVSDRSPFTRSDTFDVYLWKRFAQTAPPLAIGLLFQSSVYRNHIWRSDSIAEKSLPLTGACVVCNSDSQSIGTLMASLPKQWNKQPIDLDAIVSAVSMIAYQQ